ncbi:hypothetical protein U9M48_036110 [Paspalum notatum var. saurae]|uniref:BED-type domain-containing protein n=1 Tax=Paspalum notatum var. saurae TaxID=547442 RepID=A0AAQ3UCV4_PASNO
MEDGDDNGHSINDDLRMMGESGDDHDGGGDLGVHELFGSTAATPIDLAAGDVLGDGGGAGAGAATANNVPQSSGIPKPRKTTSPMWEDIDPIYTTIGGKTVRTGAICKWCKSSLSAGSGGGTGHLLRHARDCKVKAAAQGKQSQLKFNPDVSHNAVKIAKRVLSVIANWGCTDKVFSVTLDNASSNVKAMDQLKLAQSGYVDTLFLHQRCALHVINLIVKCGLKRFKPWLDAFRTAISFLNASNQRIVAYKMQWV